MIPSIFNQNHQIPNAENYQGIKILKMFNKASSICEKLLTDLEKLYFDNGITYSVSFYHATLIRLLTPFQLLSHFNVADNSYLLQTYQQGIQQRNPHEVYQHEFDHISNIKLEEKNIEKFNFQPQAQEQKQKSQLQKIVSKSLTQNSQIELYCWISQMLTSKIFIQSNDIALKAKSMSSSPRFVPNKNWVTRFLKRFPELHSKIRKVWNQNKGRRIKWVNRLKQNKCRSRKMELKNRQSRVSRDASRDNLPNIKKE